LLVSNVFERNELLYIISNYILYIMTTEQIQVNVEFINAKCNDVGFVFDNYENQFRNANVIDVVYNLTLNYCEQNIHNNINQPRSVDDLIFLDKNRKEEDRTIDKEDTFNDLSPNRKNYTIYVVFRLLDKQSTYEQPTTYDQPTNDQPMTLSELAGPEITGRGKKQSINKNKKRGTNKRTNKKYCSKCKSKKTLRHKHTYKKNKIKNKSK
jgi:hypothetical protein